MDSIRGPSSLRVADDSIFSPVGTGTPSPLFLLLRNCSVPISGYGPNISPFSPSFLSACAPFLHVCDVSSSCVVYDRTLSLNPKCWPRVIEISSASPSYSCGYVFLLTESDAWVHVSASVNKIWVSWRQVHGKSIETSTAF